MNRRQPLTPVLRPQGVLASVNAEPLSSKEKGRCATAILLSTTMALLLLTVGCRSESPPAEAPPSPVPTTAVDARQVTVFAIRAVEGKTGVDPRLSMVRGQLRNILPNHGFELIVSRSERLQPGETLVCDLGDDRTAETTFETDSAGRITLRCTLKDGDAPPFSTLVDAPENQLFFYERALSDGDRVLIGVGAR